MIMKKKNEVLELSFEFALQIIEYCELLEKNQKYVLAHQLLKSGTSIGANIREAQNAESIQDFSHKLKIAAKEADETEYWLLLCEKSSSYPTTKQLSTSIISIKELLNSIISTIKNKNINNLKNQ
ncbi:MAG: four helix bundle protein [Bacteroidales bacterium]|nr:four helix bundle protein [Bacteroidales bacterium]